MALWCVVTILYIILYAQDMSELPKLGAVHVNVRHLNIKFLGGLVSVYLMLFNPKCRASVPHVRGAQRVLL